MSKEIVDFINANIGNWALVIIAIAVSIIAIKIVIRFDINKYLESRKRKHIALGQNACPHMDLELIDTNDDKLEVNVKYYPWFETPYGTTKWICKRCKFVVDNVDERQLEKAARHYIDNPKAYKKAMRKADKHIKKGL
jgi:hypothetical protein